MSIQAEMRGWKTASSILNKDGYSTYMNQPATDWLWSQTHLFDTLALLPQLGKDVLEQILQFILVS